MARMNLNRNAVYLLVAVGLGGLASMMAVHYINQQVAVRTPRDAETTTVVVPVHPMQKGDILKQEDIASRNVPVAFVPADRVKKRQRFDCEPQPLELFAELLQAVQLVS